MMRTEECIELLNYYPVQLKLIQHYVDIKIKNFKKKLQTQKQSFSFTLPSNCNKHLYIHGSILYSSDLFSTPLPKTTYWIEQVIRKEMRHLHRPRLVANLKETSEARKQGELSCPHMVFFVFFLFGEITALLEPVACNLTSVTWNSSHYYSITPPSSFILIHFYFLMFSLSPLHLCSF